MECSGPSLWRCRLRRPLKLRPRVARWGADKLTPVRTAARHSSVAARRTRFAQTPRAPDVRSPWSRRAGHSGQAVTRSEDGSRARRGGGRRIPPMSRYAGFWDMVVPAAGPRRLSVWPAWPAGRRVTPSGRPSPHQYRGRLPPPALEGVAQANVFPGIACHHLVSTTLSTVRHPAPTERHGVC